jgi:hypothetical protein
MRIKIPQRLILKAVLLSIVIFLLINTVVPLFSPTTMKSISDYIVVNGQDYTLGSGTFVAVTIYYTPVNYSTFTVKIIGTPQYIMHDKFLLKIGYLYNLVPVVLNVTPMNTSRFQYFRYTVLSINSSEVPNCYVSTNFPVLVFISSNGTLLLNGSTQIKAFSDVKVLLTPSSYLVYVYREGNIIIIRNFSYYVNLILIVILDFLLFFDFDKEIVQLLLKRLGG